MGGWALIRSVKLFVVQGVSYHDLLNDIRPTRKRKDPFTFEGFENLRFKVNNPYKAFIYSISFYYNLLVDLST
jgi:hypothetical protein